MRIDEAFKLLAENNQYRSELWARPLGWKGSGQAIVLCSGHRPAVVPDPSGGAPWRANYPDIVGDWEVVEPDTVLDEACEEWRKHL